MPSLTTLFEDTSPMIFYSSGWRAGSSASDQSVERYSESSFTLTQASGSSMSFVFYGSSVAVYGAKRGNHGAYQASVDNNSLLPFNGKATPDQFNQVLLGSTVSIGLHNLTIVNGDNTFFDVDYITVESNIGLDGEDLIVNTYQDTHPAFNYTPSSFWITPVNVGTFLGGSGHNAAWCKSRVFLPGDAVAIYGPVGPNSTSGYSVQIDNGLPSLLSANKQFYRSQQLLFFAGNLGAGKHSLAIQLGTPSTGEFAIDYASVYTSPSLGGSYFSASGTVTVTAIPTSTTGNTTAICPVNARRLPPGAIAGLAVSTTFAILAGLLSIVIVWHYRRSHNLPGNPLNQPINQPLEIRSMRGPDSTRTVRPFLKYPATSSPQCSGCSASFGSDTVTYTSHSAATMPARPQRNSMTSLMTQPPQYQ